VLRIAQVVICCTLNRLVLLLPISYTLMLIMEVVSMNHFVIRRATMRDINALVTLEKECFTSDIISRQSLKHLLSAKSAEILVAEQDQKIVGSAVIFFRKNSKKARLYSLAIHAEHRQKGIAANLRDTLEKNAACRGCTSILLEVRPDNATAISFYQKHGYQLFGKFSCFYEDGTDALRMEKQI